LRSASSVAASIAVQASASAPSRMAWSAAAETVAWVKAGVWLTASVSRPMTGWIDGITWLRLPMSLEKRVIWGRPSASNERPSSSALRW
jgi:hypothetical protein